MNQKKISDLHQAGALVAKYNGHKFQEVLILIKELIKQEIDSENFFTQKSDRTTFTPKGGYLGSGSFDSTYYR